MNKWGCNHQGCSRTCVGVGGAVGLRALGWFFEPGPRIFCPEHRPDVDTGDCSLCVADITAFSAQWDIDRRYSHVPVLAMEHAKHLNAEVESA